MDEDNSCLPLEVADWTWTDAADEVPEMDDEEALRIFRQTAFLHRSVK